MNPLFVIDANLLVKLFLNYEEESELVAELLAHQLADPQQSSVAVPGFCYIECASIMRKAVRAGLCDATKARAQLTDLEMMGLHMTPTASLVGEAFEISSIYGASVYDACYVALAYRLGVPLLTVDKRLINCLQHSPYQLMTLQEYLQLIAPHFTGEQ